MLVREVIYMQAMATYAYKFIYSFIYKWNDKKLLADEQYDQWT